MEPDEARRMMLEVDKARERYHLEYAGYLPQDPNHKNLMIDAGILGVDKTVELLEDYVKLFLQCETYKKTNKCIQF